MSSTAQRHWEPIAGIEDARYRNAHGSKLLLTVVEAAQQLSIGRTLMYELLISGQVESIHVGRLHRIPAEALTEFVARQRAQRTGA